MRRASTAAPVAREVRQTDTENLTLQSDLTARTSLFGMKHELLAGIEYLKEDSSRRSLQDLDPGAGRFYRPGAFTSAPAITYKATPSPSTPRTRSSSCRTGS